MLDAHADSEGFRLHRYTPLAQHLERIARAVTGGKDNMARRENIVPLWGGNAQRADAAAVHVNIRNPMGKAHLAAAVDDLAAEVLQHDIEPVRADVGLGVEQNIPARAEADEFF